MINHPKMGSDNDSAALDASKSPISEFFIWNMKEIYWAEKTFIGILLELIEASADLEIHETYRQFLETTQTRINRLEQTLDLLNESIDSRKSEAMHGLYKQVSELIEYTEESTLRDAGIILVTERIVSDRILVYEGLIKIGNTLGREDIVILLAESLDEESLCRDKLRTMIDDLLHKAQMD